MDGLCIPQKRTFYLGIYTRQMAFRNDIKISDMERTICDILRDRNNKDIVVVSDAPKKYTSRQDKVINKLMKYAGLFKNYLEVLL